MAYDGFLFGGDTGLNYQQLQQRRAIAAALAGRSKGFPKNKGEGLTYLGESIAEGLADLKLSMMERAQRAAEAGIKAKAPGGSTSYDQTDNKPFPKAASDEGYDKDRPTEKVEAPKTTTATTEQPYFTEPTRIDVPPPAPASEWAQSAPTEAWPSSDTATAPAPAPAPDTAPPPEPVTQAPSFTDRFSAANAPPSEANLVQTTTAYPPASPASQTASLAPQAMQPSMRTAPPISRDMQNMFFSPQMGASDLNGGTKPDMSPAVPPPEQTPPGAVGQTPSDQVTLPTETRDIPLPMGNPRTTGGVRATMEAVLARGGATPAAIAGIQRNVRDESGFNPNLRHPDQPKFSGEAHFAHGLYQEGGDEWNNYVKWIDKNAPGSDWRDPKLQTQFLSERMQDPSRPDYNRMYERMNQAPNSGVAANEFLRGYLKPAAEHQASRSAQYLGESGMPTYASREVTGGASAGPAVAGMRVAPGGGRIGGAPAPDELAAIRDQVAAALVAQQQQPGAAAAAPQEEQTGGDVDPRLREVMGGRRPGSPFYAPTAALGRAGVATDAPQPGATPMGGGARDSITDSLMNQQPQPATAPVVPQPDPTQQTTSLPPSSPVGGDPVVSDAVSTPPMGATAQAGVPLAPPVGFGGMRVAQEPGPLMPPVKPQAQPAPQDTSQGIKPMPPSEEAIPPSAFPKYPDPGPKPQRLGPVPESAGQKYWGEYMHHPGVSEQMRLHAKAQYDAFEKHRLRQETQRDNDYIDAREKWQERVKRKEEETVKEPERVIKQASDRLDIQKRQLEVSRDPYEVAKLKGEIAIQEQNLSKLKDEATVRKEMGNLPQEAVIKRVGDSHDTASKALAGFQAVQSAKAAFSKGAITGFGANQRLDWAKFNQWMGLEDKGNEIANTEVFRSSMAPVIAATLKATVGTTQVSNTDRQFAEDAAGGRITLDPGTINRMMEITRRLSLEAIGKHETLVEAMYGNNPKAQALFGVELPIPEHQVRRLMENQNNPEHIAEFDKEYYRGAARRVLQRGR